jgi:hypothetical protein
MSRVANRRVADRRAAAPRARARVRGRGPEPLRGGVTQLAALAVPVLAIGALAWPLVLTHSVFYFDWVTHLWYVWQQGLALRADHAPTFFVNNGHAVFEPLYAFYGGTLYTLAGALSLLLGDAPVAAYVLTYVLAFAAAYGGWLWLGRMAGLGRWQAQVPAVVYVTSAYYLQLLYSSGDLPAFVGASMVPPLIASALSVLRADRLRLGPAAALVASGVVFFGSHAITILWGTTLMAVAALVTVACVPAARRLLTRAGAVRLAGLAVPSALLSAWYLLPAIAYASHTWLGGGEGKGRLYWEGSVREHMSIVSVGHLFTLSSAESFPGAPNSTARLPILVIAWVLVSGALYVRAGAEQTWLRILLVASGMALLVGVVMTHAGLLLALPQPYTTLQYSVRLESFVVAGVAGAVLATLVLARNSAGRARQWPWALVPVLVVTGALAAKEAAAFPPAEPGIGRTLQMRFYQRPLSDYADASLPHLDGAGNLPRVVFPPSTAHDDHASTVVHLPPGQLVDSNVGGGPELVKVTGARIVGIDPTFDDVLEVGANTGGRTGGAPTETISLSTAEGAPIVVGRLLTLAAALALLGQFAALGIRRVRGGRSAPPTPARARRRPPAPAGRR